MFYRGWTNLHKDRLEVDFGTSGRYQSRLWLEVDNGWAAPAKTDVPALW
jgi:hypothetical protein